MKKPAHKYIVLHQKREKQIIDTAKALILKRNITAVTMSDIAAACGISRQTLYKYFSSFDALLYSIQEEIIVHLPTLDATDITSYLCDMADALYHYYRTNQDDFMFICMFDVYIHTNQTEDEINRHYRSIVHQHLPKLSQIVQREIRLTGPYTVREVFACALHMIWAFITRMAVLGSYFEESGNVPEERSLEILKDMIRSYLRANGVESA